ncbi:penicillin-binding protein activator LpoB [bacterium]|nr:MAG: penicillin-binding protein activator LpoB [bacterium]
MKNLTFLGVFILFLIQSCATPSSTVSRVSLDTKTDLSGRWNDTDADMVAKEMMNDMMSSSWMTKFKDSEDRDPVLIVGKVRNESMEHIDSDVFTKDIERELINSGQVNFVARPDERQQVRQERQEQQQFASYETMKNLAQELGADFMMIGNISSIMDQNMGGSKIAVFYSVNLELINVETNQKVWIGNKKIKKLVDRKRFN